MIEKRACSEKRVHCKLLSRDIENSDEKKTISTRSEMSETYHNHRQFEFVYSEFSAEFSLNETVKLCLRLGTIARSYKNRQLCLRSVFFDNYLD